MPQQNRHTGTIVRLPEGKPFGFILDPNDHSGQGDYFFHMHDLESGRFEDLAVGDTVTFEPMEGPKGLRAVKVSSVDPSMRVDPRERRA